MFTYQKQQQSQQIDLDNFDISSHEDSSAADYNYYGSLDRSDALFKNDVGKI